MSGGGFIESPDRKATQRTVFLAVKARLVSQVKALSEGNVFITKDPDPAVTWDKGLFATISVAPSQFDQDIMEGAGQADCREYAGVQITLFNTQAIERIEQEEAILMNEQDGLFELKRQVLVAFTDHDLEWEGTPLLTDHMMPLLGPAPQKAGDRNEGIGIAFTTPFRWEL